MTPSLGFLLSKATASHLLRLTHHQSIKSKAVTFKVIPTSIDVNLGFKSLLQVTENEKIRSMYSHFMQHNAQEIADENKQLGIPQSQFAARRQQDTAAIEASLAVFYPDKDQASLARLAQQHLRLVDWHGYWQRDQRMRLLPQVMPYQTQRVQRLVQEVQGPHLLMMFHTLGWNTLVHLLLCAVAQSSKKLCLFAHHDTFLIEELS